MLHDAANPAVDETHRIAVTLFPPVDTFAIAVVLWSQHAVPSQELVISCAKDGHGAGETAEDKQWGFAKCFGDGLIMTDLCWEKWTVTYQEAELFGDGDRERETHTHIYICHICIIPYHTSPRVTSPDHAMP